MKRRCDKAGGRRGPSKGRLLCCAKSPPGIALILGQRSGPNLPQKSYASITHKTFLYEFVFHEVLTCELGRAAYSRVLDFSLERRTASTHPRGSSRGTFAGRPAASTPTAAAVDLAALELEIRASEHALARADFPDGEHSTRMGGSVDGMADRVGFLRSHRRLLGRVRATGAGRTSPMANRLAHYARDACAVPSAGIRPAWAAWNPASARRRDRIGRGQRPVGTVQLVRHEARGTAGRRGRQQLRERSPPVPATYSGVRSSAAALAVESHPAKLNPAAQR